MTRRDLAVHFAELGFTRGAEIGVEQGLYSEVLCQSIPGLVLLSVDAWTTKPEYRRHVSQPELDRFEQLARARLKPYGALVIKGLSVEVARAIPDGSLDFAYIDSDHEFCEVVADINAWLPKIRIGGVVSGHDFNLRSVRDAVSHTLGLDGVCKTDERGAHSWWVVKR